VGPQRRRNLPPEIVFLYCLIQIVQPLHTNQDLM
jgi:hypothetical protein